MRGVHHNDPVSRSVLITGINGMLGMALKQAFLADGWIVEGLGRTAMPLDRAYNALDICNHEAVGKLLREKKYFAIIHCSAAINVDECEDKPEWAMAVNTEATLNLARYSQLVGSRLVFISTDAVYPGTGVRPFREDDPLAPPNVYGISKMQAEQGIMEIDPSSLILRVNIVGWNVQKKASLAEWILNNLKAGKPMTMFTDVLFGPLYVGDAAEAIVDLLDSGATGVFNLGSSDYLSKYDFGLLVAKIFEFDASGISPISVDSFNFRAVRSKNMAMDVSRVQAYLGRPMPLIIDSLMQMKQEKSLYDRLRSEYGL